jgi:hypothetical protein
MNFKQYGQTAEYQNEATKESKGYMGVFVFVCLFVLIFRDWGLGLWWLAAFPTGLFGASIAGAPFSILGSYLDYKSVPIAGSLIKIAGLFAVIFGSYYFLKAISGWIG